jgi:hypothetical protein
LNSQKWRSDVANSAKLRTYVIYKNEYGLDRFVFKVLNRGYRSVLSKFRAGTLPLEIEVGRWRGIPVEERICKLCNSGNVENEMHFLLDCSLYLPMRNAFFGQIEERNVGFSEKTRNEQLCILMSESFIVETSKFLYNCMSKRSVTLYG